MDSHLRWAGSSAAAHSGVSPVVPGPGRGGAKGWAWQQVTESGPGGLCSHSASAAPRTSLGHWGCGHVLVQSCGRAVLELGCGCHAWHAGLGCRCGPEFAHYGSVCLDCTPCRGLFHCDNADQDCGLCLMHVRCDTFCPGCSLGLVCGLPCRAALGCALCPKCDLCCRLSCIAGPGLGLSQRSCHVPAGHSHVHVCDSQNPCSLLRHVPSPGCGPAHHHSGRCTHCGGPDRSCNLHCSRC